ncbi:MAG: hypothetical protein M1281_13820 [Chloroflexi bacterium]|nr:hypothetical protein [Chloroflexota bacterium]
MFKGWGYINDDLNTRCGFILTAVDEGSVGDKFRIQIWAADTEQLIYDNKIGAAVNDLTSGTVISSGSIIVH